MSIVPVAKDAPNAIDAKVIESVMLEGDLAKLSPEQRISWYKQRCDAAGLDPRTQPFLYITLQGKLTLYATKGCAEQLVGKHKITVQVIERNLDQDSGIYSVTCRATFPSGQVVEDIGAISIQGLRGDALANAYMKCTTKAKRRTVLSSCGLAMLDESEVGSIEGATRLSLEEGENYRPRVGFDNNSGHGRGQYASPDQVRTYELRVKSLLTDLTNRWTDGLTARLKGEIPNGMREPCPFFRLNHHLLKWAISERLIADIGETRNPNGELSTNVKTGQVSKYVAIVYQRHPEMVRDEVHGYFAGCEQEELERLGLAEPEQEDESQEEQEEKPEDERRKAVSVCLASFESIGVSRERILSHLGVQDEVEVTDYHIDSLREDFKKIKKDPSKADLLFPAVEKT